MKATGNYGPVGVLECWLYQQSSRDMVVQNILNFLRSFIIFWAIFLDCVKWSEFRVAAADTMLWLYVQCRYNVDRGRCFLDGLEDG